MGEMFWGAEEGWIANYETHAIHIFEDIASQYFVTKWFFFKGRMKYCLKDLQFISKEMYVQRNILNLTQSEGFLHLLWILESFFNLIIFQPCSSITKISTFEFSNLFSRLQTLIQNTSNKPLNTNIHFSRAWRTYQIAMLVKEQKRMVFE